MHARSAPDVDRFVMIRPGQIPKPVVPSHHESAFMSEEAYFLKKMWSSFLERRPWLDQTPMAQMQQQFSTAPTGPPAGLPTPALPQAQGSADDRTSGLQSMMTAPSVGPTSDGYGSPYGEASFPSTGFKAANVPMSEKNPTINPDHHHAPAAAEAFANHDPSRPTGLPSESRKRKRAATKTEDCELSDGPNVERKMKKGKLPIKGLKKRDIWLGAAREILDALKNSPNQTATCKALARACGKPYQKVRGNVRHLKTQGRIAHVGSVRVKEQGGRATLLFLYKYIG